MEFFYSNIPPVHEAGLLPVAHITTPGMIIPPNTYNFVIEGFCPGRCTEQVSEHVTYFSLVLSFISC